MGGAARAVQSVAQFTYDTVAAPTRAAIDVGKSLSKGEGVGTALAKGVKTSLKPTLSVLGQAKNEIMPSPQAPNMPAPPEQPSAADQATKAEEQRRKSLVDMAKDRPGRSQTVLTDQSAYPYRLV